MSIFDGLPISREKSYLREELSKIDESWAAARFDSLPHVVRILTSRDREGEVKILKEQCDIVEEVVDEVVHAYHGGFNKAIQNYSQILRFFSESTQGIGTLKVDLAEAKKLLAAHNKQLHQFWYRSVTLRHIISLLDQIEGISKVPSRIEKLIAEKQFYAAVQLHVQSAVMLEREGLQTVGALQDIRSELSKLRGAIFHKVLEELHVHLYNNGEYSSGVQSIKESDDAIPSSTAITSSLNYSHSRSRRTRSLRIDNSSGIHRPSSIDGGSSYDGHNEDGTMDIHDDATSDGYNPLARVNGGDAGARDAKALAPQIPDWLSDATPDEFVELMRKSDAPLHIKYLQTMVECLCILGKVAAAGAIISQRLRPTIHEIISNKIKAQAGHVRWPKSGLDHTASSVNTGLHYLKLRVKGHRLSNKKHQNGVSSTGAILAASPVSHAMSPVGTAQLAAKELLDAVLDTVVRIFENHVIVGELLESKSSQQANLNTPKAIAADIGWNHDSDASNDTGGYTIGFSLTVLQSECQQLICEILRATPEAASADAAVQTARLANQVPLKDKRDGSEDGLTFAFRFTDASASIPNQGADAIRQGWRKGPNANQEGYGTGAVLPEQGIYLAASVYRPVLQFTDKVSSMLPQKFSQLGNDGLLSFMENFVKDHFLPTMFVDYRKSVQQAISSPAAFRPRANAAVSYTSSVENGRPVLQGLLAIDFLAKEVLGWAQAMPKFAAGLISYVQTFLERTYERCRTSYMEAVLEKQSYMLIGRHDIENLLRIVPAGACLPSSLDRDMREIDPSDAEYAEIEKELSHILLGLRPIKQENLIRDDNKLILLASLSDSLEYLADSIESLWKSSSNTYDHVEENGTQKPMPHPKGAPKTLASFAEEYRKLALDCLKVLRIEMLLETIFHLQEMSNRVYMDDQDAEEPDDFVISLTSQITRRDEEIAPYIADVKRNYIFGGISGVAANLFIKVLAEMKSINLFGVQQICRNSIALEQALAAISSIDGDVVQIRLDRVRTYYELLNMPFEALLAFISEHENLFGPAEYKNLLKVQVPGREIPDDAEAQVSDFLPQ